MTHQHQNLFTSKEDFLAFRIQWKALHAAKLLTMELMAARCLLLGKPLNSAFAQVTNPVKLANNCGGNPFVTQARALDHVRRGWGLAGLPELSRQLAQAEAIRGQHK